MPIRWTIDHDQQMLIAEAEGDVTLEDIVKYLEAVVTAGTMPYRKLFDGSNAASAMTQEEMMALGARLRAYHGEGRIGPLAMVAASDKTHDLARLLGALAAADRPTKIFGTVKAARRWLDAQPK